MLKNYHLKRLDYFSVIIVICLFIISYFVIGSATHINSIDGTDMFVKKQSIGFLIGFLIMIILTIIDYHFIAKLAPLIYIFSIGLLLAVLLFGVNHNGAVRWIEIAGFQIQPSEFVKVFMVIVLAKFFDKFAKKINKLYIILISMGMMGIPFILIAKEDLSTSLVLIFLFGIMIFGAEISYKYIVMVLILVIPLTLGLLWYIQQPDQILLNDNRLRRVEAFINPEEYSLSATLQTENSVQAIGSGQFSGKGIYNGKLNKYNYLPEPQTDFIFSIIGEELGFVGCATVLALLLILILRLLFIALTSSDFLGRLLCIGYVSILLFQTFINVGVTTAIVPNTGLPLPYVSYGLSALLSNMAMLGILLNVSIQRKGLLKK